MGNATATIKRFLANKNTVTLITVIVSAIILYGFYSWRVSKAVTTVYVCSATQAIPARTKITTEMTQTTKVLASQVSDNMIKSCDQVIGKVSSYATEIPQNSYFYQSQIMTPEQMPNSVFDDIPDGFTIYNLSVDFNSTYGNSIMPDDYIDLYLKTTEASSGLLVYGRFIESIKVMGVKDASGQNVFETTVENRTPAQLLFSVPEDLYLLLKKSEFLGLQIVIVPRNQAYTAKQGETYVSSDYLKQLVIDQTAKIPDEVVDISTKTGTNKGKTKKADTTEKKEESESESQSQIESTKSE